MVTISHIVNKMIDENIYLQEAIGRGIASYGSVAKQLKPEIEFELRKEVAHYAVVAAIRRYSEKLNVRFKEIKFRSNAKIVINGGILKEKCIKLYNSKIREYIKQFTRSSSDNWKKYGEELLEKRRTWFHENKSKIDKLNGSDVEKAYKLLAMKLEINEEEIPIVRKTYNELVFHSKNFCPSLEACKILDLDTNI